MSKVVILGGGTGGYVAAIRAAQLGAQVALVERDLLGGTCLNRGCIPTKALLGSIQVLTHIQEAADFGIEVTGYRASLARMRARKEQIVATLRKGVQLLLRRNKVEYIAGSGRLLDLHTVAVQTAAGEQRLEADFIILATGSEPARLKGFDFSQPTIMTSTEALGLMEPPQSLLIVGAGAIGCEFACIFSALGTQITMVEMMEQILPQEDKRLAGYLAQSLSKRGIRILTKTVVESIAEYRPNGVTARLSNGETIVAEKVLISIGRAPNTRDIGLEEAGVAVNERGFVQVDAYLRTTVPNIYAVGDCKGGPLLAHVAAAEAVCAAENIHGANRQMNYEVVPSCIYTLPEVASVGLTPDKAAAAGVAVNTGRFSFGASGKALAIGQAQGFVQLVADKATDRLLGAQIFGPHATDLIHEAALAIRNGLTASQVAGTIHAHPTLSEAIMEAAHGVHGLAIHG